MMLTDLEKISRAREVTKTIMVLTDQEKEGIDHEAAKVPHRRHACLDALLLVQKNRGHISDEVLAAVAEYLDMSPAELDGIATFYNLIYRQPVGKNVIRLCDSISCHILDYQAIKNTITETINIDFGQTSKDGAFTLLPAQCLGVCNQAPVMMINDEVYGNLDKEKTKAVLAARRGA